jgi:predicted MFS family arabinose efflux permease
MGLIGMAFGLGFIFGPALGGVSWKLFGLTGPGWVAAGLCAANFLLAWAILTESWSPACEHAAARPRLNQWAHTMGHPKIAVLIVVFFLATFCFSSFETTLGLLVARNFELDTKKGDDAWTVGFLFAYCGIVAAFVQGGAIGRAVKAMGEPKLIAFSLMLVAISMAPLPFIHGHDPISWHIFVTKAGLPWINLLFFLALLAIGSGLTRPPVFGLISNLTPAHEQGATIGIAQSAGSFARIFAPIFAAALFEHYPARPYLICSGISLLAALLAWQSLCRRDIAMAPAAVPSAEEP